MRNSCVRNSPTVKAGIKRSMKNILIFQHVLLLQLNHKTEIAIETRIFLGILNPYIKTNNLRIASTT
ncbi:MAG: hypothetical protein EOM15_08045 [Spirochaetia bacterium]|nr:hypothetical protein [Spirochaetia bacterium]